MGRAIQEKSEWSEHKLIGVRAWYGLWPEYFKDDGRLEDKTRTGKRRISMVALYRFEVGIWFGKSWINVKQTKRKINKHRSNKHDRMAICLD